MDEFDLRAWLRLTLSEGIGNDAARRLLACFGSAPAIFAQTPTALQQVVTPRQAEALGREPHELPVLLARTLQWLDDAARGGGAHDRDTRNGRHGNRRAIWTLGDPAYPAALLDLPDPPLMLYAQGQCIEVEIGAASGRAVVPEAAVAIVGSRNPTPQGTQTARQLAEALCASGLCVVSGLALGIDGAAHQGALDAVPARAADACLSIAVVGTGLDRVYPRRHEGLAHALVAHGLLLSEYPLGTPPLAANFPRRNRLIAALGRGTLVVEAALHSGSLITADLALELGREVMAMPGSIHAPQARGCHALLRQGATLVESAQDVRDALRLNTALPLPATTPEIDGTTDDDLLAHLGFDPVSLDALQARSGLDTANLQARLLGLELDGRIGRLPGGLFQRLG